MENTCTKVLVSDATVTINDADATAITAAELAAIGGKTTGTVRVTNAVEVTGSITEIIAALITADSKVEVTDATVTVTGPMTEAEYNMIDAITTGKVVHIDGDGSADADVIVTRSAYDLSDNAGAGDDIIITIGAQLNNDDTIDGGADTDTITMTTMG